MGHGQPPRHDLVTRHVDDAAPVVAPVPPAVYDVGLSHSGYVTGLAVFHGQAVQVAAVLRRQTRDELRSPETLKVEPRTDRRQATEQCVHKDLPAGVIRQWRRWCLHPDYLVGVEGEPMRQAFAAVRTPLTSLSFSDDEMMSARNTESLHGFYTSAPKTMRRIAPSEVGADRIGHFGFFRDAFKPTLWSEHLLPELEQDHKDQAAALATAT